MIKKILQYIKLDKPLIVFDLEATGLAISADRIVQVAYTKILPNGREIKDDFLLNPQMEIAKDAQEIHGISNRMVVDAPTFKDKSKELWGVFNECYYSGFNILNYDLPLLRREFLRVGMDFEYKDNQVIDTKIVYHYMEPRTLSNAYKYYCDKSHKDRHNAPGDVKAASEILIEQLKKYGYDFIEKIHEEREEKYLGHERKLYWRKGEAYFAFSRFKDQSVAEVAKKNPGFLRWMLQANFPYATKKVIKKILHQENKNE